MQESEASSVNLCLIARRQECFAYTKQTMGQTVLSLVMSCQGLLHARGSHRYLGQECGCVGVYLQSGRILIYRVNVYIQSDTVLYTMVYTISSPPPPPPSAPQTPHPLRFNAVQRGGRAGAGGWGGGGGSRGGGTTIKAWTTCHLTVGHTRHLALVYIQTASRTRHTELTSQHPTRPIVRARLVLLLLFYNDVNRVCGSQCVHSVRVTVYAVDILSRPGSNQPARYVCRTFDISCKLEENVKILLQFCSFYDVSYM